MIIFCVFFLSHFQVIAVSIKNLILFDIGLNVGLAAIVTSALTGKYINEHNLNETLHLTPVQASWLSNFNLNHFNPNPENSVNWKKDLNFFQNSVKICAKEHFCNFSQKKIQAVWLIFWSHWAVLYRHSWQVKDNVFSTTKWEENCSKFWLNWTLYTHFLIKI